MISWTLIAATGAQFSDFVPYVASVNDAGTVAFQATLRGGDTGVSSPAVARRLRRPPARPFWPASRATPT